jgi:membrane fusion protein (multidrug efflux system)
VVVVAGGGWGAYEWLVASHYETTDNAYVQGNVIQITPQIGGTVLAIHADDTDFVKAGQPLVQLDPADAKVALRAGRGRAGPGGAPGAHAVRQQRLAGRAGHAAPGRHRQGAERRASAPGRPATAAARCRQRRRVEGRTEPRAVAARQRQERAAAAQAGVVAAAKQLASNQS